MPDIALKSAFARTRLHTQRVAGDRTRHPEHVARWLGALQAQDEQQALWAIALRTSSATRADVEVAFASGLLVRTWALRGTLHVVPAEDAAWMVALSAPRVLASARSRFRQLELDEPTLAACARVCEGALVGGRRLTRSALLALLREHGISTAGQRGYSILWYLAHIGLVCLGPMREREQTFLLLREWVPGARQLPREEALGALAARYFRSRGPATLADFAHWAGLTLTDARAGHETVRTSLTVDRTENTEYWRATDTAQASEAAAVDTYLLPGFDEYLLGYKDRSAVLAPEYASLVVPGGNGIFLPLVVAHGQVVGTWKREVRPRRGTVEIAAHLFRQNGLSADALIPAAARYAAYLGMPLGEVRCVIGTM